MIPALILVAAAILVFALYRRRHVKFVLKTLGTIVYFEASEQPSSSSSSAVAASRSPTISAVTIPEPNLIESGTNGRGSLSNLPQLPLTSAKHDDPDAGGGGLGNGDRQEDAAGAHSRPDRQRVGQGNLP
jgi:hypothetical protein